MLFYVKFEFSGQWLVYFVLTYSLGGSGHVLTTDWVREGGMGGKLVVLVGQHEARFSR